MSDPVHHATSKHHSDRDSATLVANEGFLRLPKSNSPQMVYVAATQGPKSLIASFASSKTGPFFKGGIYWEVPPTQPERALFLTLQLLHGIREVTCGALWCSVVSEDQTQMICIRLGKATYKFDVDFPDGEVEDPQIVITPIIA
jgi:hypothetical protein